MSRRTMKSLLSAVLLPIFCLLFFPQTSNAQPRKRLEIEQVQVGFGSLKAVAEFKSGFWTPVYIYVKLGPEGTHGPGTSTIEPTDSDDVRGHHRAAVPQLNPEGT